MLVEGIRLKINCINWRKSTRNCDKSNCFNLIWIPGVVLLFIEWWSTAAPQPATTTDSHWWGWLSGKILHDTLMMRLPALAGPQGEQLMVNYATTRMWRHGSQGYITRNKWMNDRAATEGVNVTEIKCGGLILRGRRSVCRWRGWNGRGFQLHGTLKDKCPAQTGIGIQSKLLPTEQFNERRGTCGLSGSV